MTARLPKNQLFAKMFAEPGFKITCSEWDSTEYIYFDGCILDENDEDYSLSSHEYSRYWEPYIEQPKKVKKTYYRAWLQNMEGRIFGTYFYKTKNECLSYLNLNDSEVIGWEEKEFEVDDLSR